MDRIDMRDRGDASSNIFEAPSGDEASWIESHAGSPTPDPHLDAIAIARVFGRTFAQGCPSDVEWRMTLFPGDAPRVAKRRESGRTFDMVYRIVLPDGGTRRVRDRMRRLGEHASLRIVTVLGETAAAEDRSRTPLVSSPADAQDSRPPAWLDDVLGEAVVRCDASRRVVEALGPIELMPLPKADLVGSRLHDLATLAPAIGTAWAAAVERAHDTQRAQICAYDFERDGTTRRHEARVQPLAGGGVVLVVHDVSERDRLRDKLEAVAMHDLLTGLPNLRMLRETLERWMKPRGPLLRANVPVALALVDLDRFKQTVDLAGRSVGDALLRIVAQRLQRALVAHLRASNGPVPAIDASSLDALKERLVVARIGGDQFAVALRYDDEAAGLEPLAARDDAMALATRILASASEPTRLAGQMLFVRASVGVALHPLDARDASTLYAHAEAALGRAKKGGRNQVRRHGDDEGVSAEAGSPDERALRAALSAEDFVLVYQPKCELASSLARGDDERDDRGANAVPGAVVAVEALLRWRRLDGDWLIPQAFLPLAESSGAIRPLGDWVVRTAIAEVAEQARVRGVATSLALNVSMTQLQDRAFSATVASTLAAHGWPASQLVIEVAETALVEDLRLVADTLAELSASGVRIAIDHFGVGTAGLVALKSLPIDEIKIDRSFIAGASVDAFDATVVESLVEMAHRLGIKVTAAGVEHADQVEVLARLRCDAVQGFLLGEPVMVEALFADDRLWSRTPTARRAG